MKKILKRNDLVKGRNMSLGNEHANIIDILDLSLMLNMMPEILTTPSYQIKKRT